MFRNGTGSSYGLLKWRPSWCQILILQHQVKLDITNPALPRKTVKAITFR